MESVRVGVIGVGHLGHHHARVYTEILGTELAGVVDTNPEKAATVGETLRVPSYTDIDTFFKEARPDAISIAVPTREHYQVTRKALRRDIHVLVEKPVTSTVEEAEQLLRIAEKNNLVFQVGHIERFNSAIRHVASITDHPLVLQSRRFGPYSPRVADVGVVLDLMIHDIDIILSLVDSTLLEATAVGHSVVSSYEDVASAQFLFADGTIANILVSRVSKQRLRRLEIMEAERHIAVDYEKQDVSVHRCVQGGEGRRVEIEEHPIFPKCEPLKLELQHFVSCVREGRQPLVGINDGKRALEVAVSLLRQIWEQKCDRPSEIMVAG
ncbi:MAG: Gfo/Idh/MocA family oxidoreductase [Synergistales bacterium]|nr:Gfo/Idh/MocA family oxidoreductase [Synergistales bacterium]